MVNRNGCIICLAEEGTGLVTPEITIPEYELHRTKDSSPGITMSKGRLLVLFEMGDCDLNRVDFPTGCKELDVIVRNYGSVTRAPGR